MTRTVPPRLDVIALLDDNCDWCTVPARLKMALRGGGELTFCGHHANQLTGDILRRSAQVTVEAGFDWRGIAGARRTVGSVGQAAH